MAAFESVRCRFLNRQAMSAALRLLSRRASGGAWRGCSSATRRENELELGDSSSVSAPNLISAPKLSPGRVRGITPHTELHLFSSRSVNTGLAMSGVVG